MLDKQSLKQEKDYLKRVSVRLEEKLEELNLSLENYNIRTKELSTFIADSFYDMDNEEIVVQRNLLSNLELEKFAVQNEISKKEKQQKRAYFGRIDFKEDSEENSDAFYIGMGLIDNPNGMPYVIDWRAPLSSMYYDFEPGKASYNVGGELFDGEITLKRQYKVEGKNLVYAFNSSLAISDEILQEALGNVSSFKMKNIVSTIQKEQNQIIRSDDYKTMLIQGIAGSGKTSIALHRIAYLLYKNKFASKDIVIVSPSSLFSDYIGNVLPELGEQNVEQITFEEIAKYELEGLATFESRNEMIEALLSGNKDRQMEVNYKQSFEFFESLKQFLENISTLTFTAKDIDLGNIIITAKEIDDLYKERYKTKKPAIRIEWIADYIVDKMNVVGKEADGLFKKVKNVLFGMFEIGNITDVYLAFLSAVGMNLEIFNNKKQVYFENVAPILYIKDYFIGTDSFKDFKYCVIDEMQDYSPIALDLINRRYPCLKTILGDIYQSIDRSLNHDYLTGLQKMLGDSTLIKLAKTYRSTKEISKYCQDMISLTGAENFERSGKEVEVIKIKNNLEEEVKRITKDSLEKGYKHIALITPTVKEAEELYYNLTNVENVNLVSDSSGELPEGVMIMSAGQSKGLEFDSVLSIRKKPKDRLRKNAEYITCTRALHELYILEI